jgi:hypothetical protein
MMRDPISVETAVPPTTTSVKPPVMRERSERRQRRQRPSVAASRPITGAWCG